MQVRGWAGRPGNHRAMREVGTVGKSVNMERKDDSRPSSGRIEKGCERARGPWDEAGQDGQSGRM